MIKNSNPKDERAAKGWEEGDDGCWGKSYGQLGNYSTHMTLRGWTCRSNQERNERKKLNSQQSNGSPTGKMH